MSQDVSVVVVTYNSARYIDGCIRSALDSDPPPLDLLVVDNASRDETTDVVASRYPRARLVRGRYNLGFAAASNEGIRRSDSEFVLLLNPDAILEPDTLRIMVDHLRLHPRIAIAGCRLLNDDRTLQHSIGRFPTLANQVGRLLFLHRLFPHATALQELDVRRAEYDYTHDVEWLFGAVLLVRRSAIAEVGLLDEDYFLFSEEQDWCMRMIDAGWQVTYIAEASATHLGRGGVGAPEVFVHLLRSKHTFITKHYGRTAAGLARSLLLVGLSLRYAGSAVLGKLSASEDRERHSRAYALGIRWALGRRAA